MNKIIICVDPGPANNGYALLDITSWNILEYKLISWNDLLELIWNYKSDSFKLVGIAVEKAIMYTFPKAKVNNKTVLETAFQCGRLLEASSKLNILYKERTRIEILEDIAGKSGRGKGNKLSKLDAQIYVQKILNLEKPIRPQHCNDAVCAGLSLWDHPIIQINRKKNEQRTESKKKVK